MIESFIITNSLNEQYILPLRGPSSGGLLIKSVTGLGPVNANINTNSMAIGDGSIFNSSRIDSRNIVFSLAFSSFDSNYEDVRTIETARRNAYNVFPIKDGVSIVVNTVNNGVLKPYYAEGFVESNEPDIFSSNEGSQISIVCPDPYFYDVDKTIVQNSSVIPMFHFEYANKSLNSPKTVFGSLESEDYYIEYTSPIDVGFEIEISILEPCDTLVVTKANNSIYSSAEVMVIENDFLSGDKVYISTLKGKKRIILERLDEQTNIIDSLLSDRSSWIKLNHGPNYIKINSESFTRIDHKILYRTKYIGV